MKRLKQSSRNRALTSAFWVVMGCALLSVPHAHAGDYVTYSIGAPGNSSEIAIKGDRGTGAVQPGGAYQYSFPIQVPPGPGGTAPQLAIAYTASGNGWVGKGWSLSFGAITRDTREGIPQELEGTSEGRFLLNGTLLVRQFNTNRYRTEIESHQKITYDSENNKWTVKNPDGTIEEYATAVAAIGPQNQNLGTREWLLSSVTRITSAQQNNTITFNYAELSGNNTTLYPQTITWGINNENVVDFSANIVNREDIRTSYATGSKVIENKLLTKIKVLRSGNVVRSYSLSYLESPDSLASRLVSITESGIGSESPTLTTTFTYTEDSILLSHPDSIHKQHIERLENPLNGPTPPPLHVFLESTDSLVNPSIETQGEYNANVLVADLDNDGRPEYIQGAGGPEGTESYTPTPDQSKSKVWSYSPDDGVNRWNSDDGFWVPTPFRIIKNYLISPRVLDLGVRFLDLDRDGDQDILAASIYRDGEGEPAVQQAWHNQNNNLGKDWDLIPDQNLGLPEDVYFSHYGQDAGVRIADVNGDGYPDIIKAYGPAELAVGADYPQNHVALASLYPLARNTTINSDCYNSVTRQRPSQGSAVYLKDGANASWTLADYSLPSNVFFIGAIPADEGFWHCPDQGEDNDPSTFFATIDADLGTQILDINGDGLPDIVKATSYWIDDLDQTSTQCTNPDEKQPDSACKEYYSPGNGIYLNTGNGWMKLGSGNSWVESFQGDHGVYLHNRSLDCTHNCAPPFLLLDINDDGLPDLLKNHNDNGDTPDYRYYLNTGNGWQPKVANPPSYNDFDMNYGQIFEDFNGDGRPDLLSALWLRDRVHESQGPGGWVDHSGEPVWTFQASPSTHPDFLESITTPLGGKITISYDHSTSDGMRYKHNGRLPQARYLVSEVRSNADPVGAAHDLRAKDPSNQSSGESSTTYHYEWGEFNFAQREFRGFGRVIAKTDSGADDTRDVITESFYHQEDELKGLLDLTITKNQAGVLFQATDYQYNCEVRDCRPLVGANRLVGVFDRNMIRGQEYETGTLDTDNGIPSFSGVPLKETFYVYDDYVPWAETLTNFYGTGEVYGNLIEKIEPGPTAELEDRRTRWEYSLNTSSWLVSYASSVSIFEGTSQTPAAKTENQYDYQAAGMAPLYGLLTKVVATNAHDPSDANVATQMIYDDYGNKTSDINANGHATIFVYDESSRSYVTEIRNPLGHPVHLFYHGVNATAEARDLVDEVSGRIPGALQRFVDPNSAETFYAYDPLGRLRRMYRSGQADAQLKHTYELGVPGFQHIEVQSLFDTTTAVEYRTTKHFLDGFGRIVQTRSELPSNNELVANRQYDLFGRLWRSSVPVAMPGSLDYEQPAASTKWSTTKYDVLGRVLLETNIDGSDRSFEYDGLIVTATNERGKIKKLHYDTYGRLSKVKEPDGTTQHTVYEYNVLDNLTKLTDVHGNFVTYVYDQLGRRRSMVHPDRGTWMYRYDAAGNLIEQTDAKDQTLRFDYDQLGRLVQKSAVDDDPKTTDGLLARFYYDGQQPRNGDHGLQGEVAWYDWGTDDASMPTSPPAWAPTAPVMPEFTQGETTATSDESNCQGFCASIEHHIVRSGPNRINEPLLFSITFRDLEGTTAFVELRSDSDERIAAFRKDGTTGEDPENIMDGTGHVVTRQFLVKLHELPSSVTRIVLKVQYGSFEIHHSSLTRFGSATSEGTTSVPAGPGTIYSSNGSASSMGLRSPTTGRLPVALGIGDAALERARVYKTSRVEHVAATTTEPLLLTVTLVDTPDSTIVVDLYDAEQHWIRRVAQDLTPQGNGDLVTYRLLCDLPQVQRPSEPSVDRIVIRRLGGPMQVHGSALSKAGTAVYANAPETEPGRSFDIQKGIGRLTAFLDHTGQTLFSYDERGNLAQQRKSLEGKGYITDYTYTADDLVAMATYPNSEEVSYSYDRARRLERITTHRPLSVGGAPIRLVDIPGVAGPGEQAGYNQFGQLAHVNFGSVTGSADRQYFTEYTYHSTDLRLEQLTTIRPGTPDTTLQQLGFEYDAIGNITSITDDATAPDSTQGKARLTVPDPETDYDGLDRLRKVSLPSLADPGDETLTYTFDALGNLTDHAGTIQDYGSGSGANKHPHQVRHTENAELKRDFEYDVNGNVIAMDDTVWENNVWVPGPQTRFTYDQENRLKVMETTVEAWSGSCEHSELAGQACDRIEVDYDAQGTRVRRTLTKTTASTPLVTLYIGSHYEKRPTIDNQDGTTSLYHAFGRLVAERVHAIGGMSSEGVEKIRYFFVDHLGSSSVVVNSQLAVEWVQTYEPLGMDRWSPSNKTELNDGSYKFTGHEQDYSWLYNFKARAYMPGIGNFIQADPWEGFLESPQTFNSYAYALGNALRYTDPTGHAAGEGAKIIQRRMDESPVGIYRVTNGDPVGEELGPSPQDESGILSKIGNAAVWTAEKALSIGAMFNPKVALANAAWNFVKHAWEGNYRAAGVDAVAGYTAYRSLAGASSFADEIIGLGDELDPEMVSHLAGQTMARRAELGKIAENVVERQLIQEGYTILGRQVDAIIPGVEFGRTLDFLTLNASGVMVNVESKFNTSKYNTQQQAFDQMMAIVGAVLGHNAPENLQGAQIKMRTEVRRTLP